MSDEIQRPRGVLTEADRRYLTGEYQTEDDEPTEGAEYNIRRRIRGRTQNAIKDFTLLLEHQTETDRDRVFDVHEDDELMNSIVDLISYLYLGTDESSLDFAKITASALKQAEVHREKGIDGFEVKITPYGYDTDRLLERFQNNDRSLSSEELVHLRREGEISSDEMSDFLIKKSGGGQPMGRVGSVDEIRDSEEE